MAVFFVNRVWRSRCNHDYLNNDDFWRSTSNFFTLDCDYSMKSYILNKDKTLNTRERYFVELTNNHIVGLIQKNHIIRTCLMYHAPCKVEFQPLNGRTRS